MRLTVGEEALEVAADHAPDDALLGDLTGMQVQRLHRLAIPDDGHVVRDRGDLVELVRDHDRRDAALFQPSEQAQEVR